MAQNTPPSQVQDFHLRDAEGNLIHVLQLDGSLRAIHLPQGFLDMRSSGEEPDSPPAGRLRAFFDATGALVVKDADGAVIPVGSGGGGGGDGDLVRHAYPWALRRDFENHTEGGALFFDRETFLHYPGWTVAEDLTGEAQNNNVAVATGEELDGARRTSFYEHSLDTEEGQEVTFDLRIAVPNAFAAWGASGIILKHKILVGDAAGPAGDTGSVTLEVHDPTTAGDTVAASATRSKGADVADDATYQDLQVSGAALAGMTNPHQAGDLLHLRITLAGTFSFAYTPTLRLGRLSAYFS